MLFCCEIGGCYHLILKTVLFILRHLVMENSLTARVIMNHYFQKAYIIFSIEYYYRYYNIHTLLIVITQLSVPCSKEATSSDEQCHFQHHFSGYQPVGSLPINTPNRPRLSCSAHSLSVRLPEWAETLDRLD